MTFPIPAAALLHHIAVLGKTGSGKTSTAKLIVEHVVDDGARVCVLDPIKSDWWGLTSSAGGKRAGLPFDILGGPRAHVPLHESAGAAIGELVATGALPLSIVDMADFGPGGLQRFFTDFAAALLKNMRGVVYLVVEEAHEFAPKERSGIGVENLAIHWAKKLATAGRSKGIRLILATQRTQALHNALLGSCETLIAHRFTTPADQEPIKAWLKANVDKATLEEVSGSMSSLKTGTAWVCSGEANFFKLVQFPRIRTFDNSATPTNDAGAVSVTTAQVDQERLRSIIGNAVKEAEANDPKALRKRIAELERQVREKPPAAPPERIDVPVLTDSDRDALERLTSAANILQVEIAELHAVIGRRAGAIPGGGTPHARAQVATIPHHTPAKPHHTSPRQPAEGVTGPMQRILDAIAWMESIGVPEPEQTAVAFLAGYTIGGGAYNNPRGALRTAGLIDYRGDRLVLTDAGRAAANVPDGILSNEELHQRILERLPGPEQRILRVLLQCWPRDLCNEDLARAAGYEPGGGAYNNPRGRLRSLGLIEYQQGMVRARDILFPVGRR